MSLVPMQTAAKDYFMWEGLPLCITVRSCNVLAPHKMNDETLIICQLKMEEVTLLTY